MEELWLMGIEYHKSLYATHGDLKPNILWKIVGYSQLYKKIWGYHVIPMFLGLSKNRVCAWKGDFIGKTRCCYLKVVACVDLCRPFFVEPHHISIFMDCIPGWLNKTGVWETQKSQPQTSRYPPSSCWWTSPCLLAVSVRNFVNIPYVAAFFTASACGPQKILWPVDVYTVVSASVVY